MSILGTVATAFRDITTEDRKYLGHLSMYANSRRIHFKANLKSIAGLQQDEKVLDSICDACIDAVSNFLLHNKIFLTYNGSKELKPLIERGFREASDSQFDFISKNIDELESATDFGKGGFRGFVEAFFSKEEELYIQKKEKLPPHIRYFFVETDRLLEEVEKYALIPLEGMQKMANQTLEIYKGDGIKLPKDKDFFDRFKLISNLYKKIDVRPNSEASKIRFVLDGDTIIEDTNWFDGMDRLISLYR